MRDLEQAQTAYEHAVRHNPNSIPALTYVAAVCRVRENYNKAGFFRH
jgi:glucose repression mediator protein